MVTETTLLFSIGEQSLEAQDNTNSGNISKKITGCYFRVFGETWTNNNINNKKLFTIITGIQSYR